MNSTTQTTVKTTSTGAKVKQTTVITMLDIIGFATEAGTASLSVGKQDGLIESAIEAKKKALEIFNAKALSIKNAGFTLADGRKQDKNTLAIKSAFTDSLGELSDSTKQNYYEIFRKVVNSGEKAKGMNKTEGGRAGKNKAGKVKGEKAEGEFINAIVALYNHSEFTTLSVTTKTELVKIMIAEKVLSQNDFAEAIA
jgi:hypothetical protein